MVDKAALIRVVPKSELDGTLEEAPEWAHYAQITQVGEEGNYQKVEEHQPDNVREHGLIDVISWSRTEEAARASAVHSNEFFEGVTPKKVAVLVALLR